MQSVTDQSFVDVTVDLDGKVFLRCTFERCVLCFSGSATFSTSDSRIDQSCRFMLDGAAAITVRQLHALRAAGGPFGDAAAHYLTSPKEVAVLRH